MDENLKLRNAAWTLINSYAWAYKDYQNSFFGDDVAEKRMLDAQKELDDFLYEKLKDLD